MVSGADESWGFNLHVFGFIDTYFDVGLQENVSVVRTGSVELEGVEFHKGGQYDTEFSALQFENAVGDNSNTVKSCSFHDSTAYSLNILNSKKLTITKNVFYNARTFHVKALEISEFSFQNNLMIGVIKRPTIDSKELVTCFGAWDADMPANSVQIKNNVCQGSYMHGFSLPMLTCDNLANSPYAENTVGSSDVAFIFRGIAGDCLAISGIRAFASGNAQINNFYGPSKMIYQDYIVADCGRAAGLRFGHDGKDQTAEFRNAFITAISRPTCSECYGPTAIDCSSNFAIRMLAVTVNGEMFPEKSGPGFDVICKAEVFDAKAFFTNVTFENFNQVYSTLSQCSNNVLFKPHPINQDITGVHHLSNVKCNNCSVDAFAYFTPPNPRDIGWFGGCGKILCTGNNNYMVHDWTGDLLGFQGVLIANNSEIGDNEAQCTYNAAINGHVC